MTIVCNLGMIMCILFCVIYLENVLFFVLSPND